MPNVPVLQELNLLFTFLSQSGYDYDSARRGTNLYCGNLSNNGEISPSNRDISPLTGGVNHETGGRLESFEEWLA